jgi:serine/threonine protein kinase
MENGFDENRINNKNINSSKSDETTDITNIEYMNNLLKENCKEFDEKYELLDSLNSGSVGALYKGRLRNKKNNGRELAFKFLFNSKDKDKNKDKEFLIHGKLKNKHIPIVLDYYKILNNSCILMEFTKYGDLENFKRNIIKRSCLSETLICYLAGGILDALYYIHVNNKIIHMDIKQQNILIDDFLMVKLTDFSVSINYKFVKDYIDLPKVGTSYYMSPEVLNKKRIEVTEASKIDIYSFGVLLYLLAFGYYPYNLKEVNNKDYPKIAKSIEENELKFPEEETGHSKLFINFLKNCLSKDIKKRYNIYQVMNDPWIKGYQIILNEKEKLYNANKFIVDLMCDNLINFNKYYNDGKEKENL